jgi:hypothetical protein
MPRWSHCFLGVFGFGADIDARARQLPLKALGVVNKAYTHLAHNMGGRRSHRQRQFQDSLAGLAVKAEAEAEAEADAHRDEEAVDDSDHAAAQPQAPEGVFGSGGSREAAPCASAEHATERDSCEKGTCIFPSSIASMNEKLYRPVAARA